MAIEFIGRPMTDGLWGLANDLANMPIDAFFASMYRISIAPYRICGDPTMARTLTVACAQTGSVDSEDMSSTVPRAVEMIEAASTKGVQFLTFSELFLSPFFPNRLVEDNDRFFTEPNGPV